MASEKLSSRARARRRYGDELKAKVMAECDEPSASVAKVAMSHGINANVVHRWRQLAREGQPVAAPALHSEFVPVTLTTSNGSLSGSDIRVEIRRGATAVTVSWPLSAAAECAGWLRDWLK